MRSPLLPALVLLITTTVAACSPHGTNHPKWIKQDIKVLDGDTFIFEGRLMKLAGADTPELGPWAKCWAEAALGGESRNVAANLIEGPHTDRWKLSEVTGPDAKGVTHANLITDEGDDFRDSMVVYGYAARTDGRWNWCGRDPNLHQPLQDEPPPHGPSMWWPANQKYDARAGD